MRSTAATRGEYFFGGLPTSNSAPSLLRRAKRRNFARRERLGELDRLMQPRPSFYSSGRAGKKHCTMTTCNHVRSCFLRSDERSEGVDSPICLELLGLDLRNGPEFSASGSPSSVRIALKARVICSRSQTSQLRSSTVALPSRSLAASALRNQVYGRESLQRSLQRSDVRAQRRALDQQP